MRKTDYVMVNIFLNITCFIFNKAALYVCCLCDRNLIFIYNFDKGELKAVEFSCTDLC
jgi:hypothetical protein